MNYSDWQIVDLPRLQRTCRRLALASAASGLAIGLLAGHATWAEQGEPIRASLAKVGEYLCRTHDGLKEIWRVDALHYGFACRELAVFPKVEVRLKETSR